MATEIVGLPSFPARVLGEVIATATLPLHPLHAIAHGPRRVRDIVGDITGIRPIGGIGL